AAWAGGSGGELCWVWSPSEVIALAGWPAKAGDAAVEGMPEVQAETGETKTKRGPIEGTVSRADSCASESLTVLMLLVREGRIATGVVRGDSKRKVPICRLARGLELAANQRSVQIHRAIFMSGMASGNLYLDSDDKKLTTIKFVAEKKVIYPR